MQRVHMIRSIVLKNGLSATRAVSNVEHNALFDDTSKWKPYATETTAASKNSTLLQLHVHTIG